MTTEIKILNCKPNTFINCRVEPSSLGQLLNMVFGGRGQHASSHSQTDLSLDKLSHSANVQYRKKPKRTKNSVGKVPSANI